MYDRRCSILTERNFDCLNYTFGNISRVIYSSIELSMLGMFSKQILTMFFHRDRLSAEKLDIK